MPILILLILIWIIELDRHVQVPLNLRINGTQQLKYVPISIMSASRRLATPPHPKQHTHTHTQWERGTRAPLLWERSRRADPRSGRPHGMWVLEETDLFWERQSFWVLTWADREGLPLWLPPHRACVLHAWSENKSSRWKGGNERRSLAELWLYQTSNFWKKRHNTPGVEEPNWLPSPSPVCDLVTCMFRKKVLLCHLTGCHCHPVRTLNLLSKNTLEFMNAGQGGGGEGALCNSTHRQAVNDDEREEEEKKSLALQAFLSTGTSWKLRTIK